jgi:hypothetical protein
MQCVRDHLANRTLSVTSVCQRFAIAPKTLHNVFVDTEESFAPTVRSLCRVDQRDRRRAWVRRPHLVQPRLFGAAAG